MVLEEDFERAEKLGTLAIKVTFDRVFNQWKCNNSNLNELLALMCKKVNEWFEKHMPYAETYNELWQIVALYMKGE